MKNSLLNNFIWKFAERISVQLISTVVTIILARMLAPEYYGIISMVMVFIALANIFGSDGFASALIQAKDVTKTDFCSVLYFNIAVSVILYAVLFFAAPYIAAFYGDGYDVLVPVLRVLGTVVIINSVQSVLQAYVSKKMIFRKFFFSTLIGTVTSAVVGIFMAYNGYGVWALVAQSLTSAFIGTLTLGLALGKAPRLVFSFNSIKKLFPFGVRIFGTGLLITGYVEMRALVIGKIYSSADLAYFDKAKQFPTLITTNISSSLSAVLFPKMSIEQDDVTRVKDIMRMSLRMCSYVMSPLMLGLAAVSGTFVYVVLGEAWMPIVPLMQMFCISELFQPINSANMQAIKATGRGSAYLRIEIIKKLIETVLLFCLMRISVKAIVLQILICNIAFTVVNSYPNMKYIGYGFKEQMSDLVPNILKAIVMFVAVLLLGFLPINKVLVLLIQIAVGAVLYLTLSIATKNKEYKYIKDTIKSFFKKQKP